jgi:hypothetical protein
LQVVLKLLVRTQTKTEKTNPKAGAIRGKKRPLDFCHDGNFSRPLGKKQLIAGATNEQQWSPHGIANAPVAMLGTL